MSKKAQRKIITREHVISSMKRLAVESGLKEEGLERFLKKYALQYGTLLLLRNLQAGGFRLRQAENTAEYMSSRSRSVEAIECLLKCSEDILSVGCGSGLVEVNLADRGYQVHGVDTDAMSLRVARRFAADMGVAGRFKVRRVKDERLLFKCATFDVVIYSHSLHDIHDKRLSLKESRRVLRPGGMVIIIEDKKEVSELMKTIRASSMAIVQQRVIVPGRSSANGLISAVVLIVLKR